MIAATVFATAGATTGATTQASILSTHETNTQIQGKFINVMTNSPINNADITHLQNYTGVNRATIHGCSVQTPREVSRSGCWRRTTRPT
jgi:penicillin V acylase-like amidase (Ntn superfamily)